MISNYLTLEEAAAELTERTSQTWSSRHLLTCAAKEQISIFARIPISARMVRIEPIQGEKNEIIAEAGSLPRISAKAAEALLLSDVSRFTEITYPKAAEHFGAKYRVMLPEWRLADGETAPEFRVEHCRVTAAGLEQLAANYATNHADGNSASGTMKGRKNAKSTAIPGKVPKVACGKLAIQAAWEIEQETGRAAPCADVMAKLQQWATDGTYPETLKRPVKEKRAVEWLTQDGTAKIYDTEACGKALKTWHKSRA